MNILLVNPPWHKGEMWGVRAGSRWPHIKNKEEKEYLPYPFFLGYSASLLQKHKFNVMLVDAIAEKLSDDLFYKRAKDFSPDFILLETSIPSLDIDLEYAQKLKEMTGAMIAITGPVVDIHTKEFLEENPYIGFTLIGEYEFTLLNLVQALHDREDISEIKGITYLEEEDYHHNGRPELIKDLDALPWPMREGVPIFKYWDVPGDIPTPSVQMMASRGCPYQCVFCAWPPLVYGGPYFRARDPVKVVDEMEFLVKKMHFKSVYFDDDTFNIGKDRILKLCDEIKRRNLKVPWAIMARADLMDEEMLRALKSAGLAAVKYGVETADEEMMERICKNSDLKKTTEIIKLTQALGIKTHLTFTFGVPGETEETVLKTIEYALELNPHSLQFSITTPYPGTKFYEDCEKNGYLESSEHSCFDGNYKAVISTDQLSADHLQKLMRHAYQRWGEHVLERNRFRNKVKKLFTPSFRDKQEVADAIKRTVQYHVEQYKEKKQAAKDFNQTVKDDKVILGILSGKYAFVGPTTVQLDITDHCNNSCLGCWCRSPLKKELPDLSNELSYEHILSLLDDLAVLGTQEIYFSGSGEPSMHPRFMDLIRYAKKKGFVCHINTNLINITEKNLEEFVDLGIDHLVVSVWAGDSETYINLHPNQTEKTFEDIYHKLSYLAEYKDKYFKVRPFTKLYNVICNKNYHNTWSMMDLALKTKATALEFTVMDTIPGETDVLDLSKKEAREVDHFAREITRKVTHDRHGSEGSYSFYFEDQELVFYKFDQFIRRIRSIQNNSEKSHGFDKNIIHTIPCTTPWQFVRIVPNGDVHGCLKAHRIPVGNINTERFAEIWNGPKMIDFRTHVSQKEKKGEFFSFIGNDPQAKCGCEMGCDDLDRNLQMADTMKRINASVLEEMEKKSAERSKDFASH